MNSTISVIVPIYNVAPYLARCIESICRQSYQDIQIILVNDGSTDDSDEICQRFAAEDTRIEYYLKENEGVAKARKYGCSKAWGNYLCFVDGDDYLNEVYLESMFQAAANYDLVTAGYYKEYQNSSISNYDEISTGAYTTDEEIRFVQENMIYMGNSKKRGLTPYIWNKLYKTSLSKEVFIHIDESVYFGEDSEFLYKYCILSKSIHVTGNVGYHYVVREDSAIQSRSERYLENINALYLTLYRFMVQNIVGETVILKLQKWITAMLVMTPQMMGFQEEAYIKSYIFPYDFPKDTKLLLYGAGNVGRQYHKQLETEKICEIVAWVDEKANRESGEIQPVVVVEKVSFDYIVLAVLSESLAESIRDELAVRYGIDRVKILWKEPKYPTY